MKWLKLFTLGMCASVFAAACGGEDDAEENSTFQCCVVQSLCDICICDSPTKSIANSSDEEACKSYLDSGKWGCDYGDEVDAQAKCAGR